MGTNFHTAYTVSTKNKASELNPPLSDLDKAISYAKNVIVHTDDAVSYDKSTGKLTWNGTIRILFNRADGQAIQNTIAAGNITLADNQFAYVDLNETNDSVLTVSAATVTTGAASNFVAVARLVLAYRNTASDDLFLVALKKANFRTSINVETLSAAKTLVTTDKVIQWLDPGGASRDVTAPAEADSTDLTFWIYNNADGAEEKLVFKNDGATTIATIGPGQTGIFSCDGTDWKWENDFGIYYDGVNDRVGVGTTSPDRLAHFEKSSSLTNAVQQVLRISHVTSGTPANNIAVGMEFEQETSADNNEVIATVEAIVTDVTAASEDADLVIKAMSGGAAAAECARFSVNGFSVFGATKQAQQAHIVDADGTLADITTKFNTLLADLEGYGLLASS